MDVRKNTLKKFKGKVVGGAVYVHKSAFYLLNNDQLDLISLANQLNHIHCKWNVVKFDSKFKKRLSFLDYQDFDEFEFPTLDQSYQIDLDDLTFKSRQHSNTNPPLLHRKELLIDPNHHNFRKFYEFTKVLEKLGAFENINKLGTKLRWEAELSRLSISIKDHKANFIKNKLNGH